MYYLWAAWLTLFFGKKNNFHGFRKQTLEKYLLFLKGEKATPPKNKLLVSDIVATLSHVCEIK